MLLIESEATKLWCPQCPRPSIGQSTSMSNNCIGSKCMWWTSMGPRLDNNFHPTDEPPFGYCGAADRGMVSV